MGTVQYAHNDNPFRNRLVENDISSHRKTPQSSCEVLPNTTKSRLPRQKLEFRVKEIDKRISLQLAVLGNAAPDFRDVVLGADEEERPAFMIWRVSWRFALHAPVV